MRPVIAFAPVHFRHPSPPASGFGVEHTLCGCARCGPHLTDDPVAVTCKSCRRSGLFRQALIAAVGPGADIHGTRETVGARTPIREPFRCARCTADPQPPHSDPRNCAFDAEGNFTPDNWCCATLAALTRAPWLDVMAASWVYGEDESLQPIPAFIRSDEPDNDWTGSEGFIVLTRYKTRGRCSSAVHVGDFWPARPLTLAFAERVLAYADQRAAELATT